MTDKTDLRQIFRKSGDYVHEGALDSGTTMIVEQGNCTIQGPVGDDVIMQVDGDLTLLSDTGKNFKAMVQGAFSGNIIGPGSDITATGKVDMWELGYGSKASSSKGVAMNGDTPCGEHRLFIDERRFVIMERIMPDEQVSATCPLPQTAPPEPLN